MRRALILVAFLAPVGCSIPPPPATPHVTVGLPGAGAATVAPTTNAAGMIGGRFFVARTAVLLRPGGEDSDVKRPTIKIFARTVACSDTKKGDVAFYGDEPGVEIQLARDWQSVAPEIAAVWFRRGFGTGALADGTVRVSVAGPKSGSVAVDLTTTNSNLAPSGSVRGVVAFEVCDP